MKEGTNTGKVDCRYNNIKVGDPVRPLSTETGLKPGWVDNYGSLVTIDGKISPKDWDGADYIIVTKEELEVTSAAKNIIDGKEGEIEELKKEVAKWKKAYDELTIADFDSQAMVDELRCRGYEVTCKRTIVEEL